jgi:FHA domain-containing protein
MMGDQSGGGRRMAGGRLQARSRRRWVIAGAVTGLWLLLLIVSGSLTASLVLLVLALLFLGLMAVGLRSLGIGRDHRAVQALATRPWRDGREVLALALRHMSEAFIITPNGSRLAPSSVELCMNPADVDSLANLIDLELVNASAAEAYVAEITASGAQVRQDVPIEVSVVPDPAVPVGRYSLRQGRPHALRVPAGAGFARPVPARAAPATAAAGSAAATAFDGGPGGPHSGEAATMAAWAPGDATTSAATMCALAPNPLLRLVTGDLTAQTRVSGACAGRGPAAELLLPSDPTVSRVHAQFTCAAGEWRITGVGLNGVALNGTVLMDEQVVRDGDTIRWGRRPDSLSSRVQIQP